MNAFLSLQQFVSRGLQAAAMPLICLVLTACGGSANAPPPPETGSEGAPPSTPVLTITQQPTSTSVVAPSQATFSVAANCSSGTLSVQWQSGLASGGGVSWSNILLATATSYTGPATVIGDSGIQFRANLACNGLSLTTSSIATLTVTVSAPVPPITAQATVCSGVNGRGWCWVEPRPQGSLLSSLLVDDSTNAIAVGRAGTLVRTSDAGLTWGGVVPVPYFGANVRDITDIARVDANRLVAVGGNLAMTSADNGATWSAATVSLPNGLLLKDVYFTGVRTRGTSALASALWAGGGFILRSTDGGQSWATVASPDRGLNSVTYVSDTAAIAVGDLTRVMRSSDGGQTWTDSRLDRNSSSSLRRIRMLDANVGLIASANGIYRTSDAGQNWALVTTPFVNDFLGIDARASTGVALAAGIGGALFRSTDAGQSWTRLTGYPAAAALRDVRFFSDTVALAVGSAGQLLRSTDAGVTWQAVSSSTRFTNELDAVAADVHFGGPDVGLLVGQSGMVRTIDGGRSWSNVAAFDTLLLASVAFADASTAVVLQQVLPTTSADNYDFLRTTDGGVTFGPSSVARLPARNLRFNSAGVGLAVGRNGAIWRSADRGQTWASVRAGNITESSLDQVRWASDSIAFAVSPQQQQLLRSSDAGLTWGAVTLPSNTFISAVAFISSTVGLALGQVGPDKSLFSTIDGGLTWTARTWTSLVGPAPLGAFALAYADAQTVVVIGGTTNSLPESTAATLLRSTDGGTTWSREPIGQWSGLSVLHFTSATVGVVAGDNLSILRTSTAGAL